MGTTAHTDIKQKWFTIYYKDTFYSHLVLFYLLKKGTIINEDRVHNTPITQYKPSTGDFMNSVLKKTFLNNRFYMKVQKT